MHVVDRERDRDQLGLVTPALREQRANRAVDHPRRQRPLLAGAALALEERAGDLARGVHALLDVDGQRQKICVAQAPGGSGRKDHCVALADDDCAPGLLCDPSGLERDLAAGDRHRQTGHSITAHWLPLWPPLWRRNLFLSLLELTGNRSRWRRRSRKPGSKKGRLKRTSDGSSRVNVSRRPW